MNDEVKKIAEKFLKEENLPIKNALQLATLGLTKSVGDIAELTYGVNFSQHVYNDERKHAMAEYLGYALLNWHILALTAGVSGDEIAKRFVAEWESKHNTPSIKDLLRHLKKPTVQQETTTQDKQVNREPTQVDLTK